MSEEAPHNNDTKDITPDSEATSEADDVVIEEEGETVSDAVKKLRQKNKELTADKQEYLDGWQRAKAELVNYKSKLLGETRKPAARRLKV